MPERNRYQLHFEEKTLVMEAEVATALGLTPRQGEVLFWIAKGKSNEEIGLIIGAKVRTVAKHAEQIFARIGVENRASAARLWHDYVAGLQG
jgi:DNA-binding CsgD family transcriptional regulator